MATTRRRKIRFKKKGKERGMLRPILYGLLSIFLVILVCVGIWYGARLSMFTIQDVTVTGGVTIEATRVQDIVENELRGNYILLVPYRFSYFYPHDRVVSRLSEIQKIQSVSVNRVSRKEVHVAFKEYTPEALWCLSAIAASDCYFMDDSGYAYAPAPLLEGGSLLRFIVEGESALTEKQLLNTEDLNRVETLIEVLSEKLGLRTGTVTFTKNDDMIYHINGGGKLFVARDMNIEETYENLKSILDSEEFVHLKPGNFNYIDLRFGNKVFVNEELESSLPDDVESETSSTTDEAYIDLVNE